MAKFGKFPSLSAFLGSYVEKQKKQLAKEIEREAPSIAARARSIRRRQRLQRDVVEIDAILAGREDDDDDPNGGRHVRLLVGVAKIIKTDPDVDADLRDAKANGRNVFVAVRIGDSQGIVEPIKGLAEGSTLHLKGEWITREKARAHGGERMSVLHFTHHPIGFICTEVKCYM